jgi:flagellar assembly protein FliH
VAKNVFRPTEIVALTSKVIIEPPGGEQAAAAQRKVEEVEELEEYSGPTADQLRREAEDFKLQWDKDKEILIASAKADAEKIVKDAEAAAFEEVRRKQNQGQKIRQEAEEEALKRIKEAEAKVGALESEASNRLAAVEKEAFRKGFDEGRESGYREGVDEVQRLIDRLHVILDKSMDKRAEILQETESEVVELVLIIARKVIKVISENQKNVVVSNVVQALKKLKSRGDVIIRVNIADLRLTSEHTKDFVSIAEGVKNITVIEDTQVDRGGCIIETDFGQIDARISSQLHEIEERILDVSPIKAKGKAGAGQ